jgi:hypothetical protein
MSSWFLDLIPRQPGERPEAAVERVYPGYLDDNDGDPSGDDVNVSFLVSDDPPVGREVRRWMVSVVEQLLELDVGLHVTGTEREPGRRWPLLIELESEPSALFIKVWPQCLTLWPLGYPETDAHWRAWWSVIRHFARQRYVAVPSDGMEIWRVPVSYGATRARGDGAFF